MGNGLAVQKRRHRHHCCRRGADLMAVGNWTSRGSLRKKKMPDEQADR